MTGPLLLVCLLATAAAPALPDSHPCTPSHCAFGGAGVGTAYYPGRMERVVAINVARGLLAYRGLPAASLPNCDTLGRVFLARVQAGGMWSAWTRFQQVDCSQARDWSTHTAHGSRAWLEIGAKSAVRLGLAGVGRFPVQVRLGGH